jgi:hypothetical protein
MYTIQFGPEEGNGKVKVHLFNQFGSELDHEWVLVGTTEEEAKDRFITIGSLPESVLVQFKHKDD